MLKFILGIRGASLNPSATIDKYECKQKIFYFLFLNHECQYEIA